MGGGDKSYVEKRLNISLNDSRNIPEIGILVFPSKCPGGTSIWKIPCIIPVVFVVGTLLQSLSWGDCGWGGTHWVSWFYLSNLLIFGGYNFCISLADERCKFRSPRMQDSMLWISEFSGKKTLDISWLSLGKLSGPHTDWEGAEAECLSLSARAKLRDESPKLAANSNKIQPKQGIAEPWPGLWNEVKSHITPVPEGSYGALVKGDLRVGSFELLAGTNQKKRPPISLHPV